MKKSDLKEYIKEIIVAELTEVDADKTRGTVVMPKASNPQDVKKLTTQGIDVELKEEEEDVEPTAKDIAANASLAKLQSKYSEVVKLMKTVVGKYKSAEGTEKQKYVDQLKSLTKLKKELEAMINPSMDDEDEG